MDVFSRNALHVDGPSVVPAALMPVVREGSTQGEDAAVLEC